MQSYRYKSLFIFSSLSYVGHIEEYFAKHTEKLAAHIVLPRINNRYNIVRFYRKGKLVEEKKLWSHSNIILYFLLWYVQHLYILFKYFNSREKVFSIVFMPHLFFFSSIQKLFRNIEYVFFVGDYCPSLHPIIRLYEWIRKYYHDRLLYACYLSDTLNKMFNGAVIDTQYKKTVMWGVIPAKMKKTVTDETFSLLFVGLIKESQGLELFFKFLKENKKYRINILGICDQKLYTKYQKIIKQYKIDNQVYFPNRFFSDTEVKNIAKTCHVGVAMYETGKMNMTYYTEPGKVKYYAELGLPIIMSNVSSIVPFVKKFHAGEIVLRNTLSIKEATQKIKKNYSYYIEGIQGFNSHFYYETYYKKAFRFLEEKI